VLGYRLQLHLIINAYWEALQFEIPPLAGQGRWRRCIDACRDPPDDFCGWADAQSALGSTYLVQPRSVVILLARAG
jgi:glycogen operon protein